MRGLGGPSPPRKGSASTIRSLGSDHRGLAEVPRPGHGGPRSGRARAMRGMELCAERNFSKCPRVPGPVGRVPGLVKITEAPWSSRGRGRAPSGRTGRVRAHPGCLELSPAQPLAGAPRSSLHSIEVRFLRFPPTRGYIGGPRTLRGVFGVGEHDSGVENPEKVQLFSGACRSSLFNMGVDGAAGLRRPPKGVRWC